jgi:lysyl-tRNA synthetase, class II
MAEKSLQEQREQRLRNLDSLVERGFEAYPYVFTTTATAAGLRATHPDGQPGEAWPDEEVVVAGRVDDACARWASSTFATLRDGDGRPAGLTCSRATASRETYALVKKLDLGDLDRGARAHLR